MGIDLHNLGLLGHAQDRGVAFERTIGIGRQALFISGTASIQGHATVHLGDAWGLVGGPLVGTSLRDDDQAPQLSVFLGVQRGL